MRDREHVHDGFHFLSEDGGLLFIVRLLGRFLTIGDGFRHGIFLRFADDIEDGHAVERVVVSLMRELTACLAEICQDLLRQLTGLGFELFYTFLAGLYQLFENSCFNECIRTVQINVICLNEGLS